MAKNAVEDALNRATAEQRAKAQQVIEEARRNIKLVSMQNEVTSSDADNIAKNAQAIEEAKRTIPFETMKDVDEISMPLPTPNDKSFYNSNVVDLHPNTQETIEHIEQGEGNNYQRENAVDRAMTKQAQKDQEEKQQQQARSY